MKKRVYVISLISVFMICFVVMAMRVKYVADKYYSEKNNNETANKEETTTEYINIMDIVDELPEYDSGSIKDLKMKFEWCEFPEVKDYDINNKVAKNGCYGYTTAEADEEGLISKEVYYYDKEHELPIELQGQGIFNKEVVYQSGSEFELKEEGLLGKVENIKVQEDISEYDEKYFFDVNSVNEKLKNNKVFVTADIELKSSTNWVTESDVVPKLIYLSDNGEYLKEIDDGVEGYARPDYYDLGFYDLDTEENCFLYPMRRGESVSFKVGYIVDRDKMDNAYMYYRAAASADINNSYNNIYDVLVKLK
ncbi:MAG: hypothetical protein IJA34_09045 [Lachnospiraceae bacterium]|nr:hypothetical protein [Lachnospiraceae bacterium]